MNWLVTGGCGFIGTNLVESLKRAGERHIRILDNLTVGTEADLGQVAEYSIPDRTKLSGGPEGVELVVGDILDEDLAVRAASGVNVIVHLAGNTGVQPSIDNPRSDCTANVFGTLNYLEAARANRVERFVFASSGGTVIGDAPPPIHEAMVAKPKSPYGASKSACEGYLSAYHGTYGIQTVALRFSNVYGPRSTHKNSVIARFIRRALAGQTLRIHGDGEQSRDFIYVDDLTAAIRAAGTVRGIGGEVFQIATGRETTVNELTQALIRSLERAGIPLPPLAHDDALPGEIQRNFCDTTKAERCLKWEHDTALEDGLDRTLAWFLEGHSE